MKLTSEKYTGYIVIGIILVVCSLFVMRFFEGVDIEGSSLALDWLNLYPSIEGGWLRYDDTGLRQAPWSVLPLLPLGLLSERAGWGMLTFIMVLVLVASVPRHRNRMLYIGTIFITVLSYPVLRIVADGNFEIISTAGVLLVVYAYRHERPILLALGVLLASSKPQVGLLLLVVVGVYVIVRWQPRQWLTAAGLCLLVVMLSLLIWGGEWLASLQRMQEFGSIMDSSLIASMNRTQVVPPILTNSLRAGLAIISLWLCYPTRWTLSREKAGMLIAASLLIAPYAAGGSALSVFAVGVIPLFFKRRWLGVFLIVLTNALYLMLGRNEWLFNYSAYYWTMYFLVTWAVLGWFVWMTE